ncbi:D-alanyl-D-alanine carboxypeptidase [Salipiger manganoxidans]|uniref:D-alanyl-D-alanine carboxypeptidase family protein n=1 Tax=Salipiger marinus TaxID=555512 RepID=UPI001E4668B3|nr:D-alanyl-D-alanine carboxypeptidase family protein [Salipiger manganoxidans]MCD1619676.1 D-alanyl-D-alanine carboxypeptidase [Salipiger manganoxidans]
MIRNILLALLLTLAGGAQAAIRASVVMDARTGEVYAEEGADLPHPPASLTKMMTLYLAFEALETGLRSREDPVTVSARAAAQPGSRMGLRAGQVVSLGDLVTGVALASGNDAAVALAEVLAGSEAAFVARMNARAQDLGLDGTRYANPHGLTAPGHLTTARDMSTLGRRLWLDFPEFWGLFAQQQAGGLRHTNSRFLSGYAGADGIKTGYTRAAGYNITASAMRGEKRLIVTVLGAASSAERLAEVTQRMDQGFAQAPDHAPVRRRGVPRDWMAPRDPLLVAQGGAAQDPPPVAATGPPGGVGIGVFLR